VPLPANARRLSDELDLVDWHFAGGAAQGGSDWATVLLPRRALAVPGARLPVLIAMHGKGEAVRGAEAGAYGWIRDYHLPDAVGALARGKLDGKDFGGFALPERLQAMNAALATQPYQGVIVVCPHTPNILATPGYDIHGADAFAPWVARALVPRIRQELPAAEHIGLDGVSLGGRASLLVGFAFPELFRVVATLQPAIQAAEADELTRRAKTYFAKRPDGVLRLLSTDGDYFKEAVQAFDQRLEAAHLPHLTHLVRGPHDYAFNRGPGGLEMLLFHDRALRGQPTV
jgi:iron(III)-salmochelin esterase